MGFAEDNENYHFKDDKAYTEDDVLVYNIFAFKIPRKATSDEVHRLFSQFGEVKRVHLVPDKKHSRRAAPKVGFINFADATAAAKVLQKPVHTLQNKRIAVKACDSWHQPGTEDYDSEQPASSNEAQHNGGSGDANALGAAAPNILQLNDDCLEHICKKFSLRDQVRFARVCQRFRSVCEMCWKLEHKNLILENLKDMTLWETRDFFKLAGPYIETMCGAIPEKDRERIVDFMSNSCRQVKHIDLVRCKLKAGCLRKLLEHMKTVTNLQLHDCSLNDNAVLAIRHLPKLEILSLTANYELTGNYLHKLKSVKELNLYGCGNIQSTYVIEICRLLKELRVLDIQRCERLTSAVFHEMVTNCPKLEVLKISIPNNIEYENVARLPSLRRLELLSCAPQTTLRKQLFTALAEHKAAQPGLECLIIVAKNSIDYERIEQIAHLAQLKQLTCANNAQLDDDCLRKLGELQNLEELSIKNCNAITNRGLLQLLRKCTKLRRVNVQRCSNITDAFVSDAIDLLKQYQAQRREPLLINVARTSINNYILNNVKYLASTSLLKLSLGLDDDDPIDALDFFEDDDDDGNDLDFFDDVDDEDEDDFEVDFDDANDFYVDIDDIDDEDELHDAYDMYIIGRHGDDINDFIW